MSYRALGLPALTAASPAVSSRVASTQTAPVTTGIVQAAISPWGKTQPALPVTQGWPMTLPAVWDAQGDYSKGVTEVHPSSAKFQQLSLPESDRGSYPSQGDPNAPANIDCFDYGERRIDPNTLSDAKYAQLAGQPSLLFFKEERMRRLLDTLSVPQFGFPSGLDALAYDASLQQTYSVAPGFLKAVVAARQKFSSEFPKSRWRRGAKWSFTCPQVMIDEQWNDPRGSAMKTLAMGSGALLALVWPLAPFVAIYEVMTAYRRPAIDPVNGACPRGFVSKSDLNLIQKAQQIGTKDCVLAAGNQLSFDTWVDPKNALATCVGQSVISAPSVQGPLGGLLKGVSGVYARRIPVWVAVRKVGRQIEPTPWFAGFLNCILGRAWNAQT